MALLHLEFRKVAQANIDHFDRLGGFHGEKLCLYHYPNGMGCAIGICDTEGIIIREDDNSEPINYLLGRKVEGDDDGMIRLIQSIHDYVAGSGRDLYPLRTRLSQIHIAVPDYLDDLVDSIHSGTNLTPDIYKEMMRRIAAQP